MVHRTSTFVWIVCANNQRIRSNIVSNSCCQAGSFALLIELNRRYSADRQQAVAAAWPPRTVAALALLTRYRPLEATATYPPTRSRSLSPPRARLRNHGNKAAAAPLLYRAVHLAVMSWLTPASPPLHHRLL